VQRFSGVAGCGRICSSDHRVGNWDTRSTIGRLRCLDDAGMAASRLRTHLATPGRSATAFVMSVIGHGSRTGPVGKACFPPCLTRRGVDSSESTNRRVQQERPGDCPTLLVGAAISLAWRSAGRNGNAYRRIAHDPG
jgi:hypothetical protein